MTKMKPEVVEAVEAFAKENKISKAKSMQIAQMAIDMSAPDRSNVGRKPNADTVAMREASLKWLKEQKGQFMAKDLMAAMQLQGLKCEPVDANNLLKYHGLEKVGTAEKIPGKKGRAPSLFEYNL